MSDLTTEQLQTLSKYRIPKLELGDDVIHPNYAGRSIFNIPASICQLLGAPQIAGTPLASELSSLLEERYQRVILILMDALAFHRLQDWMQDGAARIWGELADKGSLLPITSITPSTTSAALTTLWSGRSASEHGLTGYEMWMKEYGVVANTILHSPITFRGGSVGSLEHAGFDPLKYLPFPTMGTHLAENGIKTYAFQYAGIIGSGLSRMLFRDVEINAFHTAADLWINLRRLLEKPTRQKQYIWVYWSEVDHFSHLYGPDDERTAAEFATFSNAMEQFFLSRLPSSVQGESLLLLTADHGQITTEKDPRYELRNHPNLMNILHIAPTGENRLAYLYIRPGQIEAVHNYLEKTWPGEFTLIESDAAMHRGLFGPGQPHPLLAERLGEIIVAARDHAYLWWADKDNPLVGRHGGLHPHEMLVPLLAYPL